METFDSFWKLYPRKVQKIHARKAYEKALKSTPAHEILIGLRSQLSSGEWREKRYIPYPATWLSRGGWEMEQVVPLSPEVEQDTVAFVEMSLHYTDSHSVWVDAVRGLRESHQVSAYDMLNWFEPTEAVLVDGVLQIGCLDQVNADWLTRMFSDKIDLALDGLGWETVAYGVGMESTAEEL